jgi:hypothetical protein
MNSSPLIEKPMLAGSSGNESYEMIYFRENLERISDEEFLDPNILETGGEDSSFVLDILIGSNPSNSSLARKSALSESPTDSQCSEQTISDMVLDESDNDVMYYIFNYSDVSDVTLINLSPNPQPNVVDSAQIAFEALEKIKKLEWGKTTIDVNTNLVIAGQILQTRKEIISCLEIIAANHPDKKARKKLSTNAKNLGKNIHYRFNTEGKSCSCGKSGCFRSVYTSQLSWMGHSAKGFVAQSARCFDGSKGLYDSTNVVINSNVSHYLHHLSKS